MKRLAAAALFAALHTTTALAQSQADAGDSAAAPAACSNCGIVTAVRPMALRGEPQWMSTISGGVPSARPSGAVGTRSVVPHASPSTGATGATGAPAGRESDLAGRQRTVYEVVVQMEDQTTRKLHYEHRPALSVGDRVRVSGGQVYLR